MIQSLDLPQALAVRLMELDFLPGTSVTAGRSAPGGDPRVFRVDDTLQFDHSGQYAAFGRFEYA